MKVPEEQPRSILESDPAFGGASRKLDRIMEGLLFTAFGVAITLVVQELLQPNHQSSGSAPILRILVGKSTQSQLLIQGGLVIGVNWSLVFAVESIRFLHIGRGRAALGVAWSSSLHAIRWAILNYFAWGVFSIFVLAMAGPTTSIDLGVFFTSATIAGAFHSPLTWIAFFLIGEVFLSGHGEADLYRLRPAALGRLVVPNAIAGVGAGIFFSYFSRLVPIDTVFATVYSNRLVVAIFLAVWILFLWLFFHTVDQNSFMRRALQHNNTFRVWMSFFVFWLFGLLSGTGLYELFWPSVFVVSNGAP